MGSAEGELARDEIILNGGPHRFAIRLIEPARGSWAERVQAVVEVPELERLDRVELYLDETLYATLYEPPFIHPLPHPARRSTQRDANFVRGVAFLENGESIEDLVFLNPPFPAERVEVRVVELFTSVLDEEGRFVHGLPAEAFEVLEDGVPQALTHFDTLESLPIHVALLLDISKSMTPRLEIATASALRFFETVLRPQDRTASTASSRKSSALSTC